jgi:hypothetical protein
VYSVRNPYNPGARTRPPALEEAAACEPMTIDIAEVADIYVY